MEVIKVEETAPTKRKLTLKIEPEDLVPEAEEAYEGLEKEAEIPGFRKGRVPRKLLEYRFDKAIQKEAFAETVQKALDTATKEKELKAIGRPDYDETEFETAMEKISEGPVEFSVTLEVVPKFDLPEYKGIKIEIARFEVTDEMVQRNLESMRESQAVYTAVDDRGAREGDSLVVTVKATRGEAEVPALSLDKMFVDNLGSGQNLKGFDEAFIGKELDKEFEFDLTLDKDAPLYEEDGINTLHVVARIRQITQRLVPELDDDLAIDNGYENLEEMRQEVRKRFEAFKEMAIERRKENKVIEHLLEKTEVSIPSSLTQTQYLTMKYLRERQSGEDERYLSVEEKREIENNTMFQARQEAKRELILAKIAELEKMEVDDDEYFRSMSVRAREEGQQNVDKFLADIDKRGLEGFYKQEILFSKVTRWLVENNEFEMGESKNEE